MKNIPTEVHVKLQSPINDSFKCKMACDSLDIDIHKKSIHELKISNINLKENWNIGVVYGASGSGKTTLIKEIFGENVFKSILNENEPIINQFPESMSYDECAEILNSIGLNSVPCWVRPVKTLSNGQKARAEAALLMIHAIEENEITCIDEWTSVVDRTVAKVMSYCLQKFAKKKNKKIIICSCHYDIIEWVNPDWLIDCNKQEFKNRENDDFFFTEREKIIFTIRKADRSSWKYFSKYHYLSERLPGGEIHVYGLFIGENQIGFQCFANYVPHRNNSQKIFHSNRTVIHPDYQGFGLGIKLINETSALFKKEKPSIKIMGKFSSIPVYKSMIKQKQWKFIKEKFEMGSVVPGGNMKKKSGFRDEGIKTFHFEYIGHRIST